MPLTPEEQRVVLQTLQKDLSRLEDALNKVNAKLDGNGGSGGLVRRVDQISFKMSLISWIGAIVGTILLGQLTVDISGRNELTELVKSNQAISRQNAELIREIQKSIPVTP